MTIVPVDSVKYLRLCPDDDSRFPAPWKATKEQLQSVLYVAEIWSDDTGIIDYNPDSERIIVTFDDIKRDFESWDQSEEDCHYSNVFDYLADCIDNGFHPCELL